MFYKALKLLKMRWKRLMSQFSISNLAELQSVEKQMQLLDFNLNSDVTTLKN